MYNRQYYTMKRISVITGSLQQIKS